ncbi:MAG: ATP-dependent 6-phosphofructokinase [Alphaproteobacteria bacterium]|nr:ATP-dependent 6-phosphofructokinase [Alphaproteobacteria bacterium]MBN9578422.1 ATP-dependent 6-phosphofructokinase [Alphaproteobacteria bacterium]
MKLGVLTGGGDVPGLNVAIKVIVEQAARLGWSVTGIRRGWLGLLSVDPAREQSVAEWTVPLTPESVRTIGRDGGTILHTSRVEPQNLPRAIAPSHLHAHYGAAPTIDASGHVLNAIGRLGLDAIIAIGGDGTLRFAARLSREGVPVISIPKTMDNDVFGTDYAIGFSTAVTRSVDAISALRTTASSHERILIVELFGRACGQTALYAGLMSDADRTFIAECPFDPVRAAQLLEEDRRAGSSRYAVAVISEGAQVVAGTAVERGERDAYGRRRLGGIGEILGAACANASADSVIVQNLAYLMRAGPPDAMDRQIALGFGALAVELLAARMAGRMCALDGGRFRDVDIGLPLAGSKRVDAARSYDAVEYRPRLHALNGIALFGL